MAGKHRIIKTHTELLTGCNMVILQELIDDWIQKHSNADYEIKSISIATDCETAYGLITYDKSEWAEL